jgi:hypothetical protein
LALGVGEVERERAGTEREGDAAGDGDALALGLGGAAFLEAEDGGEGLGRRDDVVTGALSVEPVAVGGGADGEGLEAAVGKGDADEGAAVEGGKEIAPVGDGEESVEGGFRARGIGSVSGYAGRNLVNGEPGSWEPFQKSVLFIVIVLCFGCGMAGGSTPKFRSVNP